jgi:hypothetical protein
LLHVRVIGLVGWVRAAVAVVVLAGLVDAGVCCVGATEVAFGSVRAAFGSEGEGAGQMAGPRGVAVDQESGRVFVVDREGLRVERWSGGGVFERLWGRGVNAAGGDLCVAGEVCVSGEAGTGAGEFAGFPSGVAVDSSFGLAHGNVYAGDGANSRVQEFTPEGGFVLTFGKNVNSATHENICRAGEEAACQGGEAEIAAGAFGALQKDSVAVDGLGVVYVGDENRVQKFNAAGELLGEVALPGVGVVSGLAVDGENDMYVVGSELAGVHKYDPTGVELPGGGRDPAASSERAVITLGPAGELFVYDNFQRHVLEYAPDGTQLSSTLFEGPSSGGLTFGNTLGVLYVALESSNEVATLTAPVAGPVVVEGSERVDGVLPTSAVVHGVVNSEGPEAAEVFFEYGTSTGYGSSTAAQTLEAGFEDQPVEAGLVGLAPSTVYHFRAVVKNGSQTTLGPDQSFETAAAVSVESESVSEVTADSARLEATLNPHGVAGRFHFEYGTSTAYGASVPVPDEALGSGSEGVPVHVQIQGLTASTAYHYRVVAESALGTHAGPDQTFTSGSAPATALVDGRGWEMVSPVSKHGGVLEGFAEEGSMIQSAEDGHAFTYAATAPLSGETETPGSRSVANTQLMSVRTAPGVWATRDISTPHEEVSAVIVGKRSEYLAFSSDLSLGGLEAIGSTPLNPALMGERKEHTPYLRASSPEGTPLHTSEFVPLLTEANTPPGTKFAGNEQRPGEFVEGTQFAAMTPDGSNVILSATPPLVEGVAAGSENLYEWRAGALAFVNAVPAAPATVCGGSGPACVQPAEGASLGNQDVQTRGAVSDDGSRVVFRAEGNHLWLRDVTRGETLELDASQGGVREHPSPHAVFQVATGDGSRVFFTDDARLTPDATAKPFQPDLYMCDVRVAAGRLSCVLSDLSVDPNRNEAARVLGDLIGIDETGRYVYFAAAGALVPGAVHGGCSTEEAVGALCNLYVRDVTEAKPSLVAVVPDSDLSDWRARPNGTNLGEVTAGVSGNGRFLAFMSSRSLTGFDNRDVASGVPDLEVFEYDREHGSLVCVSCGGSGGRPRGMFESPQAGAPLVDRSHVWEGRWLAGSIPGWTKVTLGGASYRSRYLLDSGRLFFDSAVGLVAGDGNGREDVYEYEPSGVGGCMLGTGCVGLLSGGSSSEESAFLDAAVSGEDVFFLTQAQLARGVDVDGAFDVYDAHVCSSGVPCGSGVVSVAPGCSTVDSCRAAPAPQPDLFGAPASQLFSGQGNVVSPAVKPKTAAQVRAEKLSRALKACHKIKPRKRRATCERKARKRYGPRHAKGKKATIGNRAANNRRAGA